MSRMEIQSCDGCGAIARDGYNELFPEDGWMTVRREPGEDNLDVCSAECLAVVASRLVGWETPPPVKVTKATGTRTKPKRPPS